MAWLLRVQGRGFTLVEVMIVVAIIGLLASLAVPAFAQARTRSMRTKCLLNQRAVYDAVVRYEIDSGRTMHSVRSNGRDIRNILMSNGYMNPQNNFDCPTSPVKDYDDYVLLYTNRDLLGIRCTIDARGHVPFD